MENNKKIPGNKKGLYRIAFTLCILFLSGLVLTVTENNKSVEAPVSTEQKNDVNEVVSEEQIEEVVRGLSAGVEPDMSEDENEINSDALTIAEDDSFSPPVYGKVLKSFSIANPIYSKTMDDWRLHEGVDVACSYDTEVYAAQNGFVSDIGYDINLGDYITTQNGEFELKYASVSPDVNLKIGDRVSKGQIIGTVSDSCISEICDDPHLHFEIKKNGVYVDPQQFIMFQ